MTIVIFLSEPQSYYGMATAVEKYSNVLSYGLDIHDNGALELKVVQPTSARTIVYAPGAWFKFELGSASIAKMEPFLFFLK